MGDNLVPERVVDGLQGSLLQVDMSEIVAHEGDEPNALVDFLDADGLASEDLAQIDLPAAEADAPPQSR